MLDYHLLAFLVAVARFRCCMRPGVVPSFHAIDQMKLSAERMEVAAPRVLLAREGLNVSLGYATRHGFSAWQTHR